MIHLLTVVANKKLSDIDGTITPPLRVKNMKMTVAQSSLAGLLVKEYGERGKLCVILSGVI